MQQRPLIIDRTRFAQAMAAHLPQMTAVRQHFDDSSIQDIPAALSACFDPGAAEVIRPGMRVAITAGSRGIANISSILADIVARVQRLGAQPFLVAAMGSHGGATSEGQRAVLASYDITEEQVGCPISCAMETVCLGQTEAGVSAYIDQAAYQADAIILVNRVKPHSILTGDLGSGLLKMAGIGLGKAIGADSIHMHNIQEHLLPVARMVIERAPIALGVALVENAYDQTWKIECVPPNLLEEADRRLLAEARAHLPTIPFDPIDVLIIDTVGKNFSGTGMDPNVIGMHRRIGGLAQRHIARIVALDLSDESHGNAHGIGMADIITQRLLEKIDWVATYTNSLTADFPGGSKLPLTCATAHEAVALAIKPYHPQQARIVRVRNTAHLEEMWVSPALLEELAHLPGIEQIGKSTPLELM